MTDLFFPHIFAAKCELCDTCLLCFSIQKQNVLIVKMSGMVMAEGQN